MSNQSGQHPDDVRLLAYVDGELAPDAARAVSFHLEQCPACRETAGALRAALGDCLDYRRQVLDRYLPPPPTAWARLDFERVEPRPLRLLPRRYLRPVLAAAAALLLCAVVYREWSVTPSVEAATLLRQAVAAAQTRPVQVRKIRIRTRTADMVRGVGVSEAADVSLRGLFTAARFDWGDPLSAAAFRNWREGLAGKRDEISQAPDAAASGEDCYRIETRADAGAIESASLVLRVSTLEPVRERLEFRNREWVEISRVEQPSVAALPAQPEWRPDASPTAPLARDGVPQRPVEPPATVGDELRVVAALHGIGADLGDPLEVARVGSAMEVRGVGIAPARRQEIESALAGLSRVKTDFREPASIGEPSAISSQPRQTPAAPAAGSAAARIERQLGGRAEYDRFSNGVLALADSASARAYALRSLAARFPSGGEAALSASERALLLRMSREHAGAMARDLITLNKSAAPVLAELGAAPASKTAGAPPASWQDAAAALVPSAQRLERALSGLLGVTAGDDSSPASQAAMAMSDLASRVELLRRTLAAAPAN
jgi:hypothetical protein